MNPNRLFGNQGLNTGKILNGQSPMSDVRWMMYRTQATTTVMKHGFVERLHTRPLPF
jgi:hypothetical protein